MILLYSQQIENYTISNFHIQKLLKTEGFAQSETFGVGYSYPTNFLIYNHRLLTQHTFAFYLLEYVVQDFNI